MYYNNTMHVYYVHGKYFCKNTCTCMYVCVYDFILHEFHSFGMTIIPLHSAIIHLLLGSYLLPVVSRRHRHHK